MNEKFVDAIEDLLKEITFSMDVMNSDEQTELAHRLQRIYKDRPRHRAWMVKLHELLDIE